MTSADTNLPASNDIVQLARDARRRGDHQAALDLFRQASEALPNRPALAIEVATELRELGRLDEAEAMLQQHLARAPRAHAAWIGLAYIARRRGQRQAALEHFRQALALEPDHPRLPLEMATELRELGQAGAARELLERQLPGNPNAGAIWHQLGMIAQQEDDTERALECLTAGVRLQPDNLACQAALAQEYLQLGQLDSMERVLDEAPAALPGAVRLQLLRARLFVAQGKLDDAIALCRQVFTANPDNAGAATQLTEQLIRTAAFTEAEEVLTRFPATTTSQRAQFAMLRMQLAKARYDLDAALPLAEEAVALDPRNIGMLNARTNLHIMRGDSVAAGAALEATTAAAASHTALRQRKRAAPPLWQDIWQELRVNPFAARAIAAARALPVETRVSALASALRDEPEHAGTAIALLTTLNRQGAWARHEPLAGSRIPRRIVQFWDSPDIPDDILRTMMSWPRTCLGFEHQIFNDHSALAFLRAESSPPVVRAFGIANHPAMRADLFRLAYLLARGGIYADADDLCRHNVAPWLAPGYGLLLLQEDIGSIGNNFIAAEAGHPLVRAVLDEVVRNVLRKQGDSIWFLSGPGAMSVGFCRHYLDILAEGRLPAGVQVRDFYHAQQAISMHLPRNYKQGDRHWLSPKAKEQPLFRISLTVQLPAGTPNAPAVPPANPATP